MDMKKIAFVVLFVTGLLVPESLLAQYNGYKDWAAYERGLGGKTLLTDECALLAEKVLDLQLKSGAWPKHVFYPQLTDEEQSKLKKSLTESSGTLENKSTLIEIHFLSNMFQATAQRKYRRAAEHGLDYLFQSQRQVGSWSGGCGTMVNVLQFLAEIIAKKEPYSYLSDEVRGKAQQAFNQGIVFLLQSQIRVNGEPTGWSAAYQDDSLDPMPDATTGLLSINSVETAAVTLLLMNIQEPDEYVTAAIEGAVSWFRKVVIEKQKRENFINKSGKRDFRMKEDVHAPDMWCRDYTLDTHTPMYSEADGTLKPSVEELSYDRRVNISWFTNDPQKVLRRYEKWKGQLAF